MKSVCEIIIVDMNEKKVIDSDVNKFRKFYFI